MSSAVLMERNLLSAAMSAAPGCAPGTAPNLTPAQNWCVVPRCTIEFEKCTGGFKIHCRCEEEIACATLQNLCKSLAGCMCSCCCTLNGITVCNCNLACGITKCEPTADGCCITCLSGDEACCKILQCCCDALACCCDQGACCYVCFNGVPVCCGC